MPDTRIPLIVFGDGPRYHSGLARIARDLTARLYLAEEELGIRVIQVGLDAGVGWHFQAWPFFGFQQSEKDFGREAVDTVIAELQAEEAPAPIVWMITDPARCFDLTRQAQPTEPRLTYEYLTPQASFWGYFPIDAQNIHGAIGGPAAEAVKACQRVIAYGRYGAEVLKKTLQVEGLAALPHGLEPGVWVPRPLEQADDEFRVWANRGRVLDPDKPPLRIGCVATNQPRKDLALYFGTLAALIQAGIPILAWLHTDLLTKAWDIGQLAYDFGIPKDRIFVSVGELSDSQLAARYSWCDATIAPGLGEGFGYPIVESLGCGTPVVHGAYAGGAELIPGPWLLPAAGWRLESCYNLLRPLYKPEGFAGAVIQIGAKTPAQVAYCSGSVRHLWWDQLWPRWRSWVVQGLTEHRTRMEETRAAQA